MADLYCLEVHRLMLFYSTANAGIEMERHETLQADPAHAERRT